MQMNWTKNLVNFHFAWTSFVRQYPALFFPLMKLNQRLRRVQHPPLLTRNTQLVLDGFFRSGNTFAGHAFISAQPHEVIVAWHTQAPATIIRAVQWGVPTLVLIRKPEDAVLSLALKMPGVSLEQGLKEYVRYYQRLSPYREGYIVGKFEDATQHLDTLIEQVNLHFGTKFALPMPTEENVKRTLDWIEKVDRQVEGDNPTRFSIPSHIKELKKAALRDGFDSTVSRSLILKADAIYRAFVSHSKQSVPLPI